MSALTHFDALATHVTHFSGDSSDDISTFLLIVSAIAVAASGLGLIVLCARALLRRGTPPTEPWIAEALASATLHTRKYAEVEAKASVPAVRPESEPEMQPLSGPAPVTVPLPKLAPLAPAAEPPTSIGFGPSSTEPTLEMDMRAFASYTSTEDDGSPPPPSERTEVSSEREPILLVSKKRAPLQSFEVPPPPLPATSDDEPEPVTVHRSGTLPRANPAFLITLSSFNDSARRA
jgi:hypothetical protein